jgi:hypothetical protein
MVKQKANAAYLVVPRPSSARLGALCSNQVQDYGVQRAAATGIHDTPCTELHLPSSFLYASVNAVTPATAHVNPKGLLSECKCCSTAMLVLERTTAACRLQSHAVRCNQQAGGNSSSPISARG